MGILTDTLWASIAAMVVVLPLLALAWVLRPAIRQNRHFRAAFRVVAAVVVVQLVLVPVYFIWLFSDMPPMNEF